MYAPIIDVGEFAEIVSKMVVIPWDPDWDDWNPVMVAQIYNFFSQCLEVGFRTASIDYVRHFLIVSVPLYFVSCEDVSNGR